MFLALWNYFHGYVMIRVTGFSVERFVNLAALKGIYIWDIRPDKTGITMKVSITGFKMLKECAKKTKCHYKIMNRFGLPFFLNHYKKRKILGGGVLLFIAGLYILSSMVWVVDIRGNERISRNEILEGLEKMGLKAGTFKFKIDTKTISDGLIAQFEEISWAGVELKGTNIKISVAETIPKTEIVDRSTPSDIVAKTDGVITNIVTSAGTPLVRQKDVVKKGDILVSGEVVIKDGDLEVGREYVRAKAEVKAKYWEALSEELPLNYEEKKYTGNSKEDLSIHIGEKRINMIGPNLKYENYDQVLLYDKPFQIGDYVFPLSILKDSYKEYILEPRARTADEAKKELKELVEKKAGELVSENGSILNIDISFQVTDEKVTAEAALTIEERIDEQRPLTMPEEAPAPQP